MSRGIVSRREEDGLLHSGSRGWGGVREEECQREESLAGQGGEHGVEDEEREREGRVSSSRQKQIAIVCEEPRQCRA